jgi:hypothetical protein
MEKNERLIVASGEKKGMAGDDCKLHKIEYSCGGGEGVRSVMFCSAEGGGPRKVEQQQIRANKVRNPKKGTQERRQIWLVVTQPIED